MAQGVARRPAFVSLDSGLVRVLFVAREMLQTEAAGLGEFLALPVSIPEVEETVGKLLSDG